MEQRIHRMGKKSRRYTRPVIARFFTLSRQRIGLQSSEGNKGFTRGQSACKFAEGSRERKKNQWPKLRQARAEGNEHSSAGKNRANFT